MKARAALGLSLLGLMLLLESGAGPAAPPCPEGSTPLFDGTTLAGWEVVNVNADTFQAKDGAIFCNGNPTGFIRTSKQYTNFVLEFDWKHEKPEGNAGLFVWSDGLPSQDSTLFPRAIEVQIMLTPDVKDKDGKLLYTGQGDVFNIWGAKMTPLQPHPAGWSRTLPSQRVTKGAGEWNHYKVTGQDGNLTLEINGTAVSGAKNCSPRKGYICLESEGSPIWFKNLCIQELPEAAAAEAGAAAKDAPIDATGFIRLFDGATLKGWKESENLAGHWKVVDGRLVYDGKGDTLWSTTDLRDFDLVADWRWTKDHQGIMQRPLIGPDGNELKNADGSSKTIPVEERDSGIYLRGSSKSQVNIWTWPVGSGEVWGYRTDPAQSAAVRAAVTPKVAADKKPGEWNRMFIQMRGNKLTVTLNGKVVIKDAELPGIPATGPIALQSHGCPIEFQNIYVRSLQ